MSGEKIKRLLDIAILFRSWGDNFKLRSYLFDIINMVQKY